MTGHPAPSRTAVTSRYAAAVANPESLRTDEKLRRIEAVTDAALSRLDVSNLLDELLDRVRDVLQVDTAAILLLDVHARQLVATAAKGLEEEVRQGLRISVGRGFAGRIAARREPLAIGDLTGSDVVSPVLLEKGIRALLGVPMLAAGELVGVLHVGSFEPREFTAEDIRLLQLVADRASLAGQLRATSMEQAAALALQRGLLPTRLPALPGLEMSARYVPGHDLGIGGDWYDVFRLPSGWVGAVIGDVSGHGLRSAVVMGRIRSALRAYTLTSEDPAEVLTMLDRKVNHFEADSLTTAVYAMISPDRGTVRMSAAGHLSPILAVPGGGPRLTPLPTDPPLGIGRTERARRTTVLEFPPDAVLVFYTDGLVERRGQLIDDGLHVLRDAVRVGPTEDVCAEIMAATGVEQPTDDIALLTIRRH